MKVTTCCGCWSLKTGTIIIGASSIVLYLILLIRIVMNIVHLKIEADIDIKTIWIVYIVSYSVCIGISMLLIIGALKKNRCLMLPWLILGFIGIISNCIIYLFASISLFLDSRVRNGILCLIFGLLAIAIQTYLWQVVKNYRKVILTEEVDIEMGLNGNPHNYQQVAGQE